MITNKTKDQVQLQRDYYTETANQYRQMHAQGKTEHDFACAMISAYCVHYNFTSVLDVGSGTGRAVQSLSKSLPMANIIGVEPVEALRSVGHSNGIKKEQLIEGDANNLDFPDSSFDLVCELGVLHHIPKPRQAITEMLRVSKQAIFLSDSNRFGQGRIAGRYIKLLLWNAGLWPLANRLKTNGKGYSYSAGDGVAYSYSVFDDYDFISSHCKQVMILNLDGDGKRPLTGAEHIALLGLKK